MKSIRKSLCLVLSAALVASVSLVGCSGGANSSSSSSGTASAGSSASSASAEPVTLKFWVPGNAQDQNNRVVTAINKYLKDEKKSNISIDFQELGWDDAYNTKANNALSTGGGVDIIFTASWAANFRQNATAGNFAELDQYLTKYPEVVKILDQAYLDSSKINGHTYALPCNKEKFHDWGYLLRTDLVDKYKIDTKSIKSEKDMEPIFDQILTGEKGAVVPLAMAGGMDAPGWKFLDWDNLSDDDIPGALYPATADAGKTTVVNQFTAPEAVAFYKNMKNYVAKKYIRSDASALKDVVTECKTGKYFSLLSSLKPGKDAEMKASTGIGWTQVQITEDYMTNRENTGAMLAIAKSCQHKDEAAQFISWLYTDDKLLNMFVYGQEGTDYTKNSDGTVTLKDKSGYASGNGWRFGDQTKNLRLSYEAADKYDQFVKINQSAKKIQSLGFTFDASKNQTEATALKGVVQKYYKQLFCGSVKDVDATVKEFDSKMKAAGSEKLIAEMQKQFDAWRTAKK